MPESERLQLLRQQRALVLEQLALIDRQIALEAGAPPPPSGSPGPAPEPPVPAIAPRSGPTRAVAEAEAEALLAKLTATDANRPVVSKARIWMAFAAFMFSGAALIFVMWFLFYRNR